MVKSKETKIPPCGMEVKETLSKEIPFILKEIDIADIVPSRFQSREGNEGIKELAENISAHGQMVPVSIWLRKDNIYEMICGDRRNNAKKSLGHTTILARVYQDITEEDVCALHISENAERLNLNPMEEALTWEKALKYFKCNTKELCERLKIAKSSVYEKLALLKLSPEIQDKIRTGDLKYSKARELVKLTGEKTFNRANELQKIATMATAKDNPLSFDGTKSLVEFVLDDRFEEMTGDMREMVLKDPAMTPEHMKVALLIHSKLPESITAKRLSMTEKEKIAGNIQKKKISVKESLKYVTELFEEQPEAEEKKNNGYRKLMNTVDSLINILQPGNLDIFKDMTDDERGSIKFNLNGLKKRIEEAQRLIMKNTEVN